MKKKRWNSIRGSGWQKIFILMRIILSHTFAGLFYKTAGNYFHKPIPLILIE